MVKKITNDALCLLENVFDKRNKLSKGGFFVYDLTDNGVISKREARRALPLVKELEEANALKFRKNSGYSFTKKGISLVEDLKEEANNTYTDEYRLSLEDEVKRHNVFIITTAVQGKEVNKEFVKSLENFSRRNKAFKILIPCEDVVCRNKKKKLLDLAPELDSFAVAFKDLELSDKLVVGAIKMSAKQISPLTGLARLATKRNTSMIFGATKKFLEQVPSLKEGETLSILTTGAVTVNNYDTDRYMSQRTSTIAENDHTYSAVVVELDKSGHPHMRHVTASKDGSFIDLGVRYCPDGNVEGVKGSVLVLGDSHVGYVNEELHKVVMKLADTLKVKSIILHDIFNGSSITHHDNGKLLTKAVKALKGESSLDLELLAVKKYLEIVSKHAPEIVIVDSNHDNHLTRYLDECRFTKDSMNMMTALELAQQVIKGDSPLRYAIVEMLGLKSSGITWLSKDESHKEYGVELGIHGHKGANGAKGSVKTYDKCIGNCVTAHTHSASIVRETYCVGTMTNLRMDYNEGLSNWTNTCCLVYPDGNKQLVTLVKNKNTYSFRRDR